jgi:ABC-type multidrug transport system fused ATPase/permease subunit
VLDFILATMRDLPTERALRESGRGILFDELQDRIVFEDVTFRYQPAEWSDAMPTYDHWMEKHLDRSAGSEERRGLAPIPVVLRRLNLVIERGKRSALVGPSGAGKSTVVDLLVRLFDPQEGRIAVDGMDLRDIDLRSWRSRIGYVSQDTFIFSGTVRANIAFAKPSASQAEIEHAARLANAHQFIMELPQGYDTVVGDRGMKVSGGQRQRIAIARALICNPPILILDEATSSLDAESEQTVQQGIDAAAQDRTLIVIAHRLSTIVGADIIYVMDRGRIVEVGRHDELLRKDGHYARLYRMTEATMTVERPD